MGRIFLPRDSGHEFTRIMTHAIVEKRTDEYDAYHASLLSKGLTVHEANVRAGAAILPFEVVEGDYNAMVDVGINLALALIIGGSSVHYDNATAYLGVGDSTVVWGTTQTDLQAASNKLRVGMKATFPTTGTKKVTFCSDFTTGQANWAWQEWCIANAVSGATSLLNRKVENLGTKASGTWTLTVEFALA